MSIPQKPVPEKSCLHCGKPLERKRYNGRLEDRGVYMRRQYCDMLCSALGQLNQAPTLLTLRSRARRQVQLADRCELCGAEHDLGRHHVDGNPANNATDNMMTLCGTCHTKWHWEHGKKAKKRQTVCRVCDRPARWNNLCGKHHQRNKLYGDPHLTKVKQNGKYVLVRVED